MKEYFLIAREQNAPEILNQEVDKDLEDMWDRIINNGKIEKKDVRKDSPIPVHAVRSPIIVPTV